MTQTSGTSPAPTRPTLAWVAWVRLVAVLGVVAIHTAGGNAIAAKQGDHRAANLLGVALDLSFVVAVPLFVMVSGTLTLDPASFRGTGAYLRKRVLRTVPAIVFWHAAYIAYLQLYWNPTPLATTEIVRRVLSGHLVPHLYFLWIVLGLSLLAPVLIRWLDAAGRREQIITGLALAAIPALSTATRTVRDSQAVTADMPWTWWFPYLGLFVLGWALRDVVARGPVLLAATVVGLLLPALVCVQFALPGRLAVLDAIAPVSYYSATTIIASICLFVVARSTIRDGGLLGVLASPRVMRLVNPVATATLGIYACHLMILLTLMRSGRFGAVPPNGPDLLLRLLATIVLSTAVTLVARRIPLLRKVF